MKTSILLMSVLIVSSCGKTTPTYVNQPNNVKEEIKTTCPIEFGDFYSEDYLMKRFMVREELAGFTRSKNWPIFRRPDLEKLFDLWHKFEYSHETLKYFKFNKCTAIFHNNLVEVDLKSEIAVGDAIIQELKKIKIVGE